MAQFTQLDTNPFYIKNVANDSSSMYWYNGKVFLRKANTDILIGPSVLSDGLGGMSIVYTNVQSSSYTQQEGDIILAVYTNYIGTAITINLLDSLANTAMGRVLWIKDIEGSAATNNITIFCGTSLTIDGTSSYVINTNRESVHLVLINNVWCKMN